MSYLTFELSALQREITPREQKMRERGGESKDPESVPALRRSRRRVDLAVAAIVTLEEITGGILS